MHDHALPKISSNLKDTGQSAGPALVRPVEAGCPAALLDTLPRIESAVLEQLNIIFRKDRRISFEWPDGSDCTVVLRQDLQPCQGDGNSTRQVNSSKEQGTTVQEVYRSAEGKTVEMVIEAHLGPHSISLCMASAAFLEILDGGNAALLPSEIICALLESYLDSAVWEFEQVCGLMIRVSAITHNPVAFPDRGYNLFFELRRGSDRWRTSGYLSLDLPGMNCLAGILKELDQPPSWDRIGHLHIPVGFIMGRARLHLSSEINDLEGDDIVMLNGAASQSSPELSVQVDLAGNPFWLARLVDNRLVVEARLEHAMENRAKDEVQKNARATDLKDIELELVFEIGRMSMPLAEVRRIGQGYVFDLASGFPNPISIFISGRLIGSGELVRIDNRLGVRLTGDLHNQEHHDR